MTVSSMEARLNLLSSPPPFPTRSHLKHSLLSSSTSSSSSSSVLMPNEQSAPAVASVPTSSLARHFPASVLLQELRDEYRPLLHLFTEDKTSQATSDRGQMETEAFSLEEKNSVELDQLVQDLEHQFLHRTDLWNLLPPIQIGEDPSLSLTMQFLINDTEESMDVEPFNAVALARKALSASKEAASLAENPKLNGAEFTDISLTSSLNFPCQELKTVRSTQFLERRSKKRRVSKPQVTVHETYTSRNAALKKKLSEGFDRNDPLRVFLWGSDTRQLLTTEEECELIAQVQDIVRLEKEKSMLQSQFGREPTLIEWAEAFGLSCWDLKSELHSGNNSREKLINSNLRLVVHVAKQYQGRGISLQGLLQENMYTLVSKVLEAKRLCIQEGNHSPDKENLAKCVGITVEKLERLMFITRLPLSIQQPVWADQDTTFQEITADTRVEIPDISVQKQLMRQHIRDLLSILNLKERHIIRLRFGIGDGKPKSLSEIGSVFGLSKE